mgnify:CR=1 FL=1
MVLAAVAVVLVVVAVARAEVAAVPAAVVAVPPAGKPPQKRLGKEKRTQMRGRGASRK